MAYSIFLIISSWCIVFSVFISIKNVIVYRNVTNIIWQNSEDGEYLMKWISLNLSRTIV